MIQNWFNSAASGFHEALAIKSKTLNFVFSEILITLKKNGTKRERCHLTESQRLKEKQRQLVGRTVGEGEDEA